MIPNTSSILRKLDVIEIDYLYTERLANAGLWMLHPLEHTVLSTGRSMILNWVTKINGHYQVQWTFREKFPNTWGFIEKVAKGQGIGKAYWHVVPPGAVAKPHVDTKNTYIAAGDVDKRYNLFIDIPKDIDFRLDGIDKPINYLNDLEYSLLDLAANKVHSVRNNTTEPFYVLVFDTLNPGVAIHKDLYSINFGAERLK